MTVAAQHEVHAACFENRQRILPHLDQLRLRVRIVRAFRVRRVMPEGDNPVLRRRSEIGLEPSEHRASRSADRCHRIKADEMNAPVVKRVIFLRARGHAARLGGCRQVEDAEIRRRADVRIRVLRRLVIADGGPQHRLPQISRIHVEHRSLILRVGARVVGVVAEHQPHVRVPIVRERRVAVAHRCGHRVLRPGIPEHPNTRRLRRADGRRGEKVKLTPRRERRRRAADGIPILRVRRQPRERHLMLRRRSRIVLRQSETTRARAELHPAVRRHARAPADDDTRGRAHLQIRPARHRHTAARHKPRRPHRPIHERAVDRIARAIRRSRANALIQPPTPDEAGRIGDFEILVIRDVLRGARVIPNARLIQRAEEKARRHANRVHRTAERRVLDAVAARGAAHHELRVLHSIKIKPPSRPVIRRRRVVPDIIRNRRHPRDGMIQPRRRTARALLEISHEHIVRRADAEEIIHILRRAIRLTAALRNERDRTHAAAARRSRHARTRALEPALKRERRHTQPRCVAKGHVIIHAIERNRVVHSEGSRRHCDSKNEGNESAEEWME